MSLVSSGKKYLFFYLKTGGGHYAPAKAIADMMADNSNTGSTVVSLADGMDNAPNWIKRFIVDGYSFSQSRFIKLFEIVYAFHKVRFIAKMSAIIVSRTLYKSIACRIELEQPIVIVNFHFFLISPIKKVVDSLKTNIRVITVVTDPFSAHPLWFLERKQELIVFSEKVVHDACKAGIKKELVKKFSFPVDKKFSVPLTVSQIEEFTLAHSLSNRRKRVLILGGGDGLPGAKSLTRNLADKNLDCEILIVCGRDKRFKAYAEEIKRTKRMNNIHVFSFVPFVRELIAVSDIVITKCGASTIMEVLILGKIPIVNKYIWEQEKGNMEFVCGMEMGLYINDVTKLAEEISRMLKNTKLLSKYHDAINRQKIRNGVNDIANFLLG